MTLSTSDLAYVDCYKLLDQALDARKGIRIQYASENDVNYQASRFNKARALDRIKNTTLHQVGDLLYGKSLYDGISIRKRSDDNGVWYVILVKIEALAEGLKVDELAEDDEMLMASQPPQGEKMTLELLPAPAEPRVRRI